MTNKMMSFSLALLLLRSSTAPPLSLRWFSYGFEKIDVTICVGKTALSCYCSQRYICCLLKQTGKVLSSKVFVMSILWTSVILSKYTILISIINWHSEIAVSLQALSLHPPPPPLPLLSPLCHFLLRKSVHMSIQNKGYIHPLLSRIAAYKWLKSEQCFSSSECQNFYCNICNRCILHLCNFIANKFFLFSTTTKICWFNTQSAICILCNHVPCHRKHL